MDFVNVRWIWKLLWRETADLRRLMGRMQLSETYLVSNCTFLDVIMDRMFWVYGDVQCVVASISKANTNTFHAVNERLFALFYLWVMSTFEVVLKQISTANLFQSLVTFNCIPFRTWHECNFGVFTCESAPYAGISKRTPVGASDQQQAAAVQKSAYAKPVH